jgi:hypothetical protein
MEQVRPYADTLMRIIAAFYLRSMSHAYGNLGQSVFLMGAIYTLVQANFAGSLLPHVKGLVYAFALTVPGDHQRPQEHDADFVKDQIELLAGLIQTNTMTVSIYNSSAL